MGQAAQVTIRICNHSRLNIDLQFQRIGITSFRRRNAPDTGESVWLQLARMAVPSGKNEACSTGNIGSQIGSPVTTSQSRTVRSRQTNFIWLRDRHIHNE